MPHLPIGRGRVVEKRGHVGLELDGRSLRRREPGTSAPVTHGRRAAECAGGRCCHSGIAPGTNRVSAFTVNPPRPSFSTKTWAVRGS